jgi:hypothetical protein
MAAPFATTAGVPATIAQRFRGVAITQRAAAWAVQAGKHTSLAGHWEIDRARARISAHGLQGSPAKLRSDPGPAKSAPGFRGVVWWGETSRRRTDLWPRLESAASRRAL